MEVHGKNIGQMERYMFHCREELREKLKSVSGDFEDRNSVNQMLKEKEVEGVRKELEMVECIHLLLLRLEEAENLFFPEITLDEEYQKRASAKFDFKDSWLEK